MQPETTRTGLEKGVQDFAPHIQPFTCPQLKITAIGSFIALPPSETCDELNHLARQCVQDFECFRAPLNDSEMQKRLRSPLTPQQQHTLKQWGYPYILEEFRFHMTLSDRLPDNMVEEARRQFTLDFRYS